MKKTAPYGSWPSEITTDLMTAGTIGLSEARLFQNEIYWLESRPQEQGRSVIVKMTKTGDKQELFSQDYSCRSRVHEYGGASYLPTQAGVFFVSHSDQQIYCVNPALKVSKLTDSPSVRFADLHYNSKNSTLIAIAEEHNDTFAEPANSLVAIDTGNGEITHLHEGQDFYASASFSPDGTKLCWLSWMHPNMPWDETTLWQAEFTNVKTLTDIRVVAGGSAESIFQPEWSPSGELYFVSDKTNWWNICRLNSNAIEPVCAMQAEFGLPLWQFGMTRYAFIDKNTIITSYSQSGVENLATIDLLSGLLKDIEREHTQYSSIRADATQGLDKFCFIAQSSVDFPAVYVSDLASELMVVASAKTNVEKAQFSIAEPISYKTENNQLAHGFYYPPTHAEYQGHRNELPPLLVMIHGGPTSASSDSLSLKIQYWTNRGFAVFDVNHRGSTGFGRQYRDALKLQWGVVDVQDCDYGVKYLIERGLVDKERIAIRGGSAGGFTVLAALALTDSFKAGTSLYGVTDLTALATDTHKFESRYLDSLIGPYPQEKERYTQRSPLSHAQSIEAPVLFLQGLDDKVVPPSQANAMIEKLLANSVRVAYLPFEGEAHGFRKSDTITRAFEAELWFYGKVFTFMPSDTIEALEFL